MGLGRRGGDRDAVADDRDAVFQDQGGVAEHRGDVGLRAIDGDVGSGSGA
jgi:hypothetical protein